MTRVTTPAYFPPRDVTRARVAASVTRNVPRDAKAPRVRPLVVRDSRSFA